MTNKLKIKFVLIIAAFISLTCCGFVKYSVRGLTPPAFYVADGTNNRVLVWNLFPTSTQQRADMVLGQPDMYTATAGTSATTFSGPNRVYTDGSRLYVAEVTNHRVLVWRNLPTYNQQPADFVLGQPDFTTGTSGTSSTKMNVPAQVLAVQGKLFVSEFSNNRIIGWNTIPDATQQPADFVLGQPDMTVGTANQCGCVVPGSNTMRGPSWVSSDGGRLFMADFSNHRVLIWNSIPTTTNQPADIVLGQSLMTTANVNDGGIGANTLRAPGSVETNGTKLLVVERDNHRALIWNNIPTITKQAADVVLGQPDMVTATSGTTASKMSSPIGGYIDKNKVYIVDVGNRRVLIWNSIPTSNGQPADIVLGQPDFATNTANTTPTGMNGPQGISMNSLLPGISIPGGY